MVATVPFERHFGLSENEVRAKIHINFITSTLTWLSDPQEIGPHVLACQNGLTGTFG